MTTRKILTLTDLASQAQTLQAQDKRIVHCHGVFDLLHLGHLRYFEAAKRHGDVLVVTITADEYVNKGPGRPVFTSDQRAEMLASLGIVDFVAVNHEKTAVSAITAIRPDFYVKGSDYASDQLDITCNIAREKAALLEIGGQYVVTDEVTFSSSSLINDYLTPHDPATAEWLAQFKARFSEFQIMQALDDIKKLRVLVLGEAIIDEYLMCEALGKSSKDPVLAFREMSLERQLGGSFAIAKHCAGLGAHVTLGTEVGKESHIIDLIARDLPDTVLRMLYLNENSSTIVKRRYVDAGSMQRVFESYVMTENTSFYESGLILHLRKLLVEDFDLVIICDYGHGFFSDQVINYLCKTKYKLAVNTQANAGNRGFNTISRYTRSDFICLNGGELALELRRRKDIPTRFIQELSRKMGAYALLVTEGPHGLTVHGAQRERIHVPAFAHFVRDRVGAGDAVFALGSLLFRSGAPLEILAFWGSLAGSIAVTRLGNQEPVDRASMQRAGISLLK